MSLFHPYNYKSRPDLRKDAPVKNGFFTFWEVYFRKFWRMMEINIIYFLVVLPLIIWGHYIVNNYMASYLSADFDDFLPGIGFFAALMSNVPSIVYLILFVASLLLYGPITMGVTYIFRNFAREEHAWLSDLWDRARSNWKQGLFFGLLDIGVFFLLGSNIMGNIVADSLSSSIWLLISKYVSIVVLIFYLMIRHYTYMIAVSVNLSVWAILKNSLLFLVIGFGRNLLAGIVCLVFWVVALLTVPLITVIVLPLLAFSFTGFTVVFSCYPVVKKYIILPALERDAAVQEEPKAEEESIAELPENTESDEAAEEEE